MDTARWKLCIIDLHLLDSFFPTVYVILVTSCRAHGVRGRLLHVEPEQDAAIECREAGSLYLFSHLEVGGRIL